MKDTEPSMLHQEGVVKLGQFDYVTEIYPRYTFVATRTTIGEFWHKINHNLI